MVSLNYLSSNLVILLEEILKNQNICKLLYYQDSNPYNKPDIDSKSLMFNHIFPFPFDVEAQHKENVQLRVYFSEIRFGKHQKLEFSVLNFDIICSKSKEVWLFNDGEPKIRPYELLSELMSHLSERSIETLGVIRFLKSFPIYVNNDFHGIRLTADVMTIGK